MTHSSPPSPFRNGLTAAALWVCLFSPFGFSQNFFPFVPDWDHCTPESAIDLSALNEKPAGAQGRVIARNGHFEASATGKKIRFLGVNFCVAANFPSHEDADRIALRLSKMGVNLVRIHHHDNRKASPLWTTTDTSAPGVFSGDGVDRLDYLIAALKNQGVYVNLNLHVSRSYYPADGFPESVSQIASQYHKRIDNFNRRMIDLQKQFARDYLGRVNPYTRMSLATDPCVAIVEINNENSLVGWAGDRTTFFDKLPEPFRTEWFASWNTWLKHRYTNDMARRAAWAPQAPAEKNGEPIDFTNREGESEFWHLEDSTRQAEINRQTGNPADPTAVMVNIPEKPAADWNVQLARSGLHFTEGTAYVISFEAKADGPRVMPVKASLDQSDYHNIGLGQGATLTTAWQRFSFRFQAGKPLPHHNRVTFVLGGGTGTVWLRGVTLLHAPPPGELPATQTMAAGNIDLPPTGCHRAALDWNRFLIDTELAYADEMRNYLRKDLGVRACVMDTQIEYGAMSGFIREAGSDFSDTHAYWDHPTFPSGKWTDPNWKIGNSSMVSSLATAKATTFDRMALHRLAGKPHSVSEYNHSAPNDFQSEMFPMLSSYAAAQDWDLLTIFEYGDYDSRVSNNRIQSFFSIAQNPGKEGFFPGAALIFRMGGLGALPACATLSLPQSRVEAGGYVAPEWTTANGGNPVNLLATRFQVRLEDIPGPSHLMVETNITTAAPRLSLDLRTPGGIYIAEGRAAVAIAGFVAGNTFETAAAKFIFPPFSSQFASLMLTPLDQKPVAESLRILLTVIGRTENLAMGWNRERTGVGTNWGPGPTQAEGIPLTLVLANPFIKRAWALGPSGARLKEVPVEIKGGRATLVGDPKYQTIWYELGAPQ